MTTKLDGGLGVVKALVVGPLVEELFLRLSLPSLANTISTHARLVASPSPHSAPGNPILQPATAMHTGKCYRVT